MKQYEPCVQNDNNNNNNIIIIIIIIKRKKRKMGQTESVEGERALERFLFLFFSSLRLFLRSTKIGSQVFVGTEGKVDLRDKSYA